MMNGLLSFWVADIKKIRERVQHMGDLIDKISISAVLKNELRLSLDIILKLLSKGKTSATTYNRYGDGDKVRNQQRQRDNGGDT